MDPRRNIPVMALLGLSCSQCTDRGLDAGAEGLIGDWEAIEIDGKQYPVVMKSTDQDGPAVEARSGWDLHIASKDVGTLAYFQEYGLAADDEALYRSEFYSDIDIDDGDGDAAKIRLTMKGDLVHLHDEPYQTTITSDGGESGYADSGVTDSGYGSDTGYGGETGDATGYGGLDDDERMFDEFERDLHAGPHPVRAAAMILDCELKAEQLHCMRQIGADDDGAAKVWTFARAGDEA